MVSSEDFLSTKIDVLSKRINTKHIPFTNDTHRKVVDLINNITKASELSKELEVILGIPIRTHITTYFELVRDE